MDENVENGELVELTANIVSAYVSKNTVVPTDLPSIIVDVHKALKQAKIESSTPEKEKPDPKVPIRKSINDDYIICLEDGEKFKSLKRHLRTRYNLTPEEYREKWGLPADYPMVAPNYAKARSQLAKKMGLGQRRK